MTTNTTSSTQATIAAKSLTVILADESYGIAVLKVREIIHLQPITTVPQMPDFVRGVITLRDRIIPIVDLRLESGLDTQADARTSIVVVHVASSSQAEMHLGLVVDAVDEVLNLNARDLAIPTNSSTAMRPDRLLGIAKVRERLKALLGIDRALLHEALAGLEALS